MTRTLSGCLLYVSLYVHTLCISSLYSTHQELALFLNISVSLDCPVRTYRTYTFSVFLVGIESRSRRAADNKVLVVPSETNDGCC